MDNQASPFDEYYYQHGCGEPYVRNDTWLNMFGGIARRIKTEINPRSVLDAGCAMGFLVECLRNEGVEAFGIDISNYAIEHAHESIQPYVRVASVSEPFNRRYDLIVTIEVLEHMERSEAEKAVENLCKFTDDILFSSTPFDYREATHYNVQMPEYWAEQFARHGFYRDVDFDASFITPWAFRFRRRNDPLHRIIRDYERKFWILNKENIDLRGYLNEIQTRMPEAEESQKLKNENTQLKEQMKQLEAENADLQMGNIGKIRNRINTVRWFLIPQGSKREKWLKKVKAIMS